ncbi:TetR/AcrR family transcriptional regulator [Nocardia aobensis]|uniref:TetR/AcrR family transcriptional regulator n=1 Tax=Nocardia aobensis TaxID=257277 RepID=UPI0002F0D2AA|nr:TetR/AcrR family transcriptional regulator [Nocardia aobensis]
MFAKSSPTDGRRSRLSARDRRASIIEAATDVFAEFGYYRSTMGEVAHRVGVTEPVVFQNFGTKMALYTAVVESSASRMCALIDTLAEQATSAEELLSAVVGPARVDELHAPGAVGVIFADAMALQTEPAVREVLRHSIRKIASVLAAKVDDGKNAGQLRADVDAEAAAWLVLSFLAGHGFRSAVMPDRKRLETKLSEYTLAALLDR